MLNAVDQQTPRARVVINRFSDDSDLSVQSPSVRKASSGKSAETLRGMPATPHPFPDSMRTGIGARAKCCKIERVGRFRPDANPTGVNTMKARQLLHFRELACKVLLHG